MIYKVKAKFKFEHAKAFYKALTEGDIAKQQPDGPEIINSMHRASVSQEGDITWTQMCFCSKPLEHERATVYDKYFENMVTETVPSQAFIPGESFMKKLMDSFTIRAVRFNEYGGSDVLKVEAIAMPELGLNQIRILVHAAGVNQIDFKIREGYFRDMRPLSFPAGVGRDAAGIVVGIGENVTNVKLGDAVFGSGQNVTAEYAVLDNWAAKPISLSFEEAAGYPVPVETAYRIIRQINIKPEETILISGAAGAVGAAVIQILKLKKINIIGTASLARHDYLKSLGVIPTTYEPGLSERVKDLVHVQIQAALDLVGFGIIPELVKITNNPGNVVSIVDPSAPQFGAKASFEPEKMTEALENAAKLHEEGSFTLPVTRVFNISEVGAAHDLSANGHATGRIIIKIK